MQVNLRVCAVALTIELCGAPALGQVAYQPKQEQIPDFSRFVPEHEAGESIAEEVVLERVTTAVPWGRGMARVDDDIVVLSRGRHRGEGGVNQSIIDQAGTLWRVDTSVSERVIPGEWAGEAVRDNVEVFAPPTSPPFHLYDYEVPPEEDILMSRPYCALAFDEQSRNLFVCAYSGAELPTGFRKHATDAVYRYDLRDKQWHVVEQHDPSNTPRDALTAVTPSNYYPHHDPASNSPPHGWVNGPDGCIGVGEYLYVPAKDNHVIVQYDLDEIRRDPSAPPPASRVVIDSTMIVSHPGGEEEMELLGPSSVRNHGDYLYIAYRTSSVVVRVPLDDEGDIVRDPSGKVRGELIAVFEPWDPRKSRSGNVYDIAMSAAGDLFVSLGTNGCVWRITPDPARPFYGNDESDRPVTAPPFLDMSELLGRETTCNNMYFDDRENYLYVSSRANDNGEGEIHGTIYRVKIPLQ